LISAFNKEELKTKLAENMVSKMLNVDNNLTEDELETLVFHFWEIGIASK
jgi:hypothetical protein